MVRLSDRALAKAVAWTVFLAVVAALVLVTMVWLAPWLLAPAQQM